MPGVAGPRHGQGYRSPSVKVGKPIVVSLLILAGISVHYRDLLASAFATNPFPGSAASIARGKALYETHCTACHGPTGRGDGPAAAAMAVSMDDLSDLPPPPIFPDGVIVYRIANGKDLMPAWKNTLSHNDLWDLLNHLRSLHAGSKR